MLTQATKGRRLRFSIAIEHFQYRHANSSNPAIDVIYVLSNFQSLPLRLPLSGSTYSTIIGPKAN